MKTNLTFEKTTFLKRAITTSLVVLFVAINTAFVANIKGINSDTVIIYGIVYVEKCNSEAYQYYVYDYADKDNYYEKQTELKAALMRDYPNADRIRVGSSKYDYGTSANAMCMIKWQIVNSNNCYYEFASIYFGDSSSAALNKALSEKNKWAGTNANYTILKQVSW